jgi:cytochrome oxidase assembly protein ShyY1
VRTLLTRRWLGLFAVAVIASATMVLLGRWQFGRYELRSAINERIDRSVVVAPIPVAEVLEVPQTKGQPAASPPDAASWTRVTMTGRYDPSQEILIRNRTVLGRVGYEVITPLILADGLAVLVDRGWVPPNPSGMTAPPDVPSPPGGEVTVTGRVHLTESDPGMVEQRNGHWETRRVGLSQLAAKLPYPLFGAYVLADEGAPGSAALVAIPVGHENDWLNLGYAVQWWIFSVGVLVGVGWLARKELRQLAASTTE